MVQQLPLLQPLHQQMLMKNKPNGNLTYSFHQIHIILLMILLLLEHMPTDFQLKLMPLLRQIMVLFLLLLPKMLLKPLLALQRCQLLQLLKTQLLYLVQLMLQVTLYVGYLRIVLPLHLLLVLPVIPQLRLQLLLDLEE